jgi:Phosphodiester glycosidase
MTRGKKRSLEPGRGRRAIGGVTRSRARWALLITCVALAVCAGVYQDQVLATPGYATWQDRSSTWIRQVGLGGWLDRYQNWRYGHRSPPDTAPDPRLVRATAGAATSTGALSPPSADLPVLAHTADNNAGWHPVTWKPGGSAAVYTAVLQPDPLHRSVIAGVALLRSSAVQAHLMAGTVDPPGATSPGRIPAATLPAVVAAFNSGLKLSAQSGGFVLDGATLRAPVDGKASLVIDDRGHVTLGQWGRDVRMTPHVRSVRQNLALIVDGGHPVNGLDRNRDVQWGDAGNQSQFTWRSAVGVTARGDVIYLAGDKLTLASLAAGLAQAGATSGMELTMHPGDEFCSIWQADRSGTTRPRLLIPTMVGPVDRYVRPNQEDFLYFTAATR